jgi:hypothetical protein
MSVSSEGDGEGGKWSAWVAGMVAERAREVDRPGLAERADDEVAQAGHDLQAPPVRTWKASSAKLTSRRECRPFEPVLLVQAASSSALRCPSGSMLDAS